MLQHCFQRGFLNNLRSCLFLSSKANFILPSTSKSVHSHREEWNCNHQTLLGIDQKELLSPQSQNLQQRRHAGRWTDQPLFSWMVCRNFSSDLDGNVDAENTPEESVPKRNEEASLTSASEQKKELDLSREEAAPIYFQPEKSEKIVWRTDRGPGGKVLAGFRLWRKSIDLSQTTELQYHGMTNIERSIYIDHMIAVQKREMTYVDPYTGDTVMTVSQLLLNGYCCGNGCRHCPYGHVKVPEEKRKKIAWNGAFYV